MNRSGVWNGCRLRASFICLWLSKVPHASAGMWDGLPANTTHSPNAGAMLCQRRRQWPNNIPAMGVLFLFAGWGRHSLTVVLVLYRPAYLTCWLAYVYRYVLPLENSPLNLTARKLKKNVINSTSMYNTRCIFVPWIANKKYRIIHGDIR